MAKNPTLALNTLERLKLRVKHGVLAEPTKAMEILRRYPPDRKPALVGKLKQLDVQGTRLATLYRERASESPLVPVEGRDRDPATWFAQRQSERVRRGATEEEAARLVADELASERREALDRAQRLDELKVPETVATFQEKLGSKPWTEWSTTEQAELDGWLMTEVLGWSWRVERMCDEEMADEAPGELGRALIGVRGWVFGIREPDDAAFVFGGDSADDEVDDTLFNTLQDRAQAKQWVEWTDDEKAEMDAFLDTVGDTFIIGDPERGTTLRPEDMTRDELRLEVFPELCTTYFPSSFGAERSEPVAGPTYDKDGRRLVSVKYASEADELARMLARHGLFPETDIDELIKQSLEAPPGEEADHIPKELAETLLDARMPESYASRRVAAARQAAKEVRFMDRIYSRPPLAAAEEEEEETAAPSEEETVVQT